MTKSNLISKKSPRDMTAEEKQGYYLQKWEQVKPVLGLHEDEYGVQMVNHNWHYFITNYPRVFSMADYGTPYRELAYCTNASKNAKTVGDNKQLAVCLTLPNGKCPTFRITRLIKEYFPVSTFNPANSQENLDCHHIQPYDPAKGVANNRLENLQLVPKTSVHAKIFTPLQKSKLTENGMAITENKKFVKALSELGEDAKRGFAIVSEIDKDTGEITGVMGEQDVQALIQNEEIRKYMQAVSNAYALELDQAKAAYLHTHWEQARRSNGRLWFVGEIDTSCPEGRRLYELTGGNAE